MEGTTIVLACNEAKEQMRAMAAELWGVPVDEVAVDKGGARAGDTSLAWGEIIGSYFRATDMEIIGRGQIRPVGDWGLLPPSWETPIVGIRVGVDPETGEWWVKSFVDVADIGLAINPALADGQDLGSGMMGLGMALREALVYEGQQLTNASVLAYRVPEFADLPDFVRTIVIENQDGLGPYGSKAHGDGSMASVVPAVSNALYDALGVRLREAPFTPERVWRAARDADNGHQPQQGGAIPEWWTASHHE
jgi:CO/xanthine dehydrogenase Mo-binding subunit